MRAQASSPSTPRKADLAAADDGHFLSRADELMSQSKRLGVLVINFGEPENPTPETVEAFLERIFLQNAGLEPNEVALARARQLARERAPSLVEEYAAMGGSPLKPQADAQARALEAELVARGHDVRTYSAFQFVPPFVHERVAAARADGSETLIVVPVYPLCGTSTTEAAIMDVHRALTGLAWSPGLFSVSGWHHHPEYVALRAEHAQAYMRAHELDARDPDTLLYFSVHGTPIKYLEEGSRYDRYVDEHCRDVARLVGADRYAVGFQNHTNRRVRWTQPDNEERIRELTERRLVVVPISFMHEQSETLVELDHGVRSFAESLGKEFHRVPVPHDSARFHGVLADLVEGLLAGAAAPLFARCRCVAAGRTWCTNGMRDLPPSPYAPADV
jgi:ferrochelatase